MKPTSLIFGAGLAAGSIVQRATNMSICDYYTTALLVDNNLTNQAILLTLVVNTAVIGNYTQPNVNVSVPGILAPGKFNGQDVNLLPYFSGVIASSNLPGSKAQKGVAVNWLDGGGADPLLMNQLGTDGSHQSTLMIHLYTYFAGLLGCSQFGKSDETKYTGDPSMYNVHKYMALSNAEVGYFIEQVGLAAASFGVTEADVKAVGAALTAAFGYKCSPKAAVVGTQVELQSICIEDDCPLAKNAVCDAYAAVTLPQFSNGTAYHDGGKGNGSTTATTSGAKNGTASATKGVPGPAKNSGAVNGMSNAAAEITSVSLVLAVLLGLGFAVM